jgi:hypothetical protein
VRTRYPWNSILSTLKKKKKKKRADAWNWRRCLTTKFCSGRFPKMRTKSVFTLLLRSGTSKSICYLLTCNVSRIHGLQKLYATDFQGNQWPLAIKFFALLTSKVTNLTCVLVGIDNWWGGWLLQMKRSSNRSLFSGHLFFTNVLCCGSQKSKRAPFW